MTTPSTVQHGTGGTGERPPVPLTRLVHLMAEYQKLGAHRQTFLPASMSEDTFVRACGLIAGGLAIVAGICATASWWTGTIVFAILALIPLVAAWLRGSLTGAVRTARMDMFDHGLTVYRSGQEITAFRWDTAEVRQSVIPLHGSAAATTTEYSLTLDGPDGSHESFDERQFDGAHEWGPAIQSAVTAAQLPRAVAAIDAGQRVPFGEIAVDLAELAFAGSNYPWEQVDTIDAQGGLIRFKSGSRWVTLPPIEAIPNFYIFNEVAERLRMAAATEIAEAGVRRSGTVDTPLDPAHAVVENPSTPEVPGEGSPEAESSVEVSPDAESPDAESPSDESRAAESLNDESQDVETLSDEVRSTRSDEVRSEV
ncbi:DUF6585 family protein [Nocardia jiangxiensis]|uniref:DUF6585 family protein n=1 Tax=Nocardia jiangxiensis TaxID=282685 RepID=A0ABW6RU53_9NOCA|nr:DUF6585 family protein [Nocardia jiangxiensis]